jgi:hypothetical protein
VCFVSYLQLYSVWRYRCRKVRPTFETYEYISEGKFKCQHVKRLGLATARRVPKFSVTREPFSIRKGKFLFAYRWLHCDRKELHPCNTRTRILVRAVLPSRVQVLQLFMVLCLDLGFAMVYIYQCCLAFPLRDCTLLYLSILLHLYNIHMKYYTTVSSTMQHFKKNTLKF